MAHLVDSGRLSLDDLKEIEGRIKGQESQTPEGGAAKKGGARG